MTPPSRPPYRRSLLQQERSLNTRRAILRAAVDLFGSGDFETTPVEDLCRAAGIGRSTFYLYFDSKEQLLIALAEATAQGVAGEVDATAGAVTVDAAVEVFVAGLVRRMQDVSPRLAAVVMRRVSAAKVNPRPALDETILFDDILAGIIREGQARGEIRSEHDPCQVGEVLAAITLDALERWAAEPGGRPLRARLEFGLGTFIDALRT